MGQALFSNGAARGGRACRGRRRSNGKQTGGSDTASKNSQGSRSSNPQAPTHKPPSALDMVKKKRIRCLEPGHPWSRCKARIPPAPEQTSGGGAQGQNNDDETVCCLAKCMLGTNDDSCNEERSDCIGEKWIADSGASFNMTHSADLLIDVSLCDDKVRIGDSHLIDVVGYGTLTVVFPGDLTVKLLDVAYAPEIAFNLFPLMAAHKQGVAFTTEEKDLYISLFNGRLRFEGDGSSCSGFDYRIEPDHGYVPFPLETANPPETCAEYGCDFPLTFPVLAPGNTASTDTRVDINVFRCVQGHSDELLL